MLRPSVWLRAHRMLITEAKKENASPTPARKGPWGEVCRPPALGRRPPSAAHGPGTLSGVGADGGVKAQAARRLPARRPLTVEAEVETTPHPRSGATPFGLAFNSPNLKGAVSGRY